MRRGNVGFTSSNHTAEDQIALIHGLGSHLLGVRGYIDNTDLFKIMCKYFNIEFINPTMTAKAATPILKVWIPANSGKDT